MRPEQPWSRELATAREAARAGSQVVREAFGKEVATEFKGDADPVTVVDRRAQAEILEVIHQQFPEDSTMAEESAAFENGDWDRGRVWLVDPLDGTVNFIHAIPQVAVSVALWVDASPVAAVIIDVARTEEFTAIAGGGAYVGGQPITVSTQRKLDHSLIATGFPYDRNLHGVSYAANLGEVLIRVQGIRRLGSAALDLAWVACGRYEGYWEFGIKPWDAGAGVLLVAEAGGTITNHQGDQHRLTDQGIVASNGSIHSDLLAAIGIAPPSHIHD